ncbi:hypothetical protein L6164_003886 [Bauhinia variegata]|uniref:Uncharacterized protein n=1 Tax=Bauhinia variegata TaxID=167791 RepID=A0ACB9Q242_BAUVA|nr:hypothetical protein L6164_003886 [Bauhinia variegata]
MQMKMKINKACDINSISVLPPHTRRSSNGPSGLQASQLRSQPSQQSFSHGLSSQHAMLSQFSPNSLDEAVTNDQRLGSLERENSMKKSSCFLPLTYAREESQQPNSRSSTNPMRRWNSADHTSHLSEGLAHRIGMMETSLNRFGMILDSIQSDIMQVNKGTKEITLEMECIRQKLFAQDNSLQLMSKGQAEIKESIDENLKSLSDQVNKDTWQEKLQEIFLVVSTLPGLIEASLQKVQNELCNTFTKEMQVISRSLKCLNQKDLAPSILSRKSISNQVTVQRKPKHLTKEAKVDVLANVAPHIETGGWKSVKKDKVTLSNRVSDKEHKQKGSCSEKRLMGGRDCRIVIESDEEDDGSFSCLVEDTVDLYGNLTNEAKDETERILRKARKRKRKNCNTIIIN